MGRKKRIENVIKEMVNGYGFEEENLKNIDEEEIREMYEEVKNDNVASDAIEALESIKEEKSDEIENSIDEDEVVPSKKDIMDLFREDEKGRIEDSGDEYVKIEGLRRVFCELKGQIVNQEIRMNPISIGETNGVSVIMTIYYKDMENGETISLSDGADGIPFYNIDREYGKYPTAIAITRAEGRIYRKALNIKAVCFEEVANDVPEFFSNKESDMIESVQIAAIKGLCKKKSISIEDAIKEVGCSGSLDKLKKEDAINITRFLNNYKEK